MGKGERLEMGARVELGQELLSEPVPLGGPQESDPLQKEQKNQEVVG
jgi:hypothetical protein